MSSERAPPLVQRLTLSAWFAVGLSVALVVVSLVLGFYADAASRAQAIRQGSVQAEILASSLAAPLAFDDHGAVEDYLNALRANPAIEAAAAYGQSGRLTVGFRRAGGAPPSTIQLGPPRLLDGELILTAPVIQGSTRLGSVYLRIATDPLPRRLARYVGVASIILMASLLVAAMGSANARLMEAHRKLQAEILERERAEAALRQAQKMEAMGQLTGGVAHDFNNLLMVASSGLELMERTTDPVRRDRLKAGIRHAIDRGAKLTQQLLTFARKTPMKTEVIDLRAVLEGMQSVLDRSLREDIGVEIIAEGEIWPVELDPAQFEVAVLNIAINARDAMPNGGTITIRLANEAERVRVAISDSGVGISPDALTRVFEPFFTTKAVGEGTGLGLSQVYGFVRASGGEVLLDSALGVGTTVTMLLPRASRAAPLHRAAPSAAATPGAKLDVLLVEDDDHVAEVVAEMLQHLGHEPRRVGNAAEALTTLGAGVKIDLVLTDMVMPGPLSGLDLAKRVMAERPHTPVILMTGYSASAAEAAGEGLRLLVKPYRIEALAAELDGALQARSQP